MAGSRVDKVQKNVVMSIFQNALNVLLGFLGRILFVRILDESYLGIKGLFTNILGILTLADLGMSTVLMFRLYRPLAENDTDKIAALIGFFRRIYRGIALVVLGAGLAFLPFLRFVVNLERPVPFLEGYYLLELLNVMLSYLFVYRTVLLAADQKMYVLNRYNMAFRVITFVAQGTVLILFRNYFIYLVAASVVGLAGNMCQNAVALRMYPYLRGEAGRLDKEERGHIFQDVKAMFLYRLAGTIQTNTDNVLISIFVGTVYVGYYSNYTMVIGHVTGVISLAFNALKASVGNLVADREMSGEEKLLFFQACEMVNFWMAGFCSVCFVGLFQDLIRICFGDAYLLSLPVVIMAVLNFYTSNIRQSIWVFRETTGLFRETKYITLVTAVLNVILSLAFGYWWGMFGILFATVLARMLYAWWREPVVLYHTIFRRSASSYIVTYIRRGALCAAMCAAVYMVCGWVTFRNPYLEFLVHALVCCAVPNAVFLCIFWRSREFQYIWRKLLPCGFGKALPENRLQNAAEDAKMKL